MKKAILFIIFLFYMSNFIISEPQIEQLDTKYVTKVKNLDPKSKPGNQYLLLIAINKYQNRLPYDYCINNAKQLRNILYEKYYINNVIELYDDKAKYEEIQTIFKELKNKLKPEDSIIIYYCGASFYDLTEKAGYWLPYDAGINESKKNNWLSNKYIEDQLNGIQANHILLISDACFISKKLNTVKFSIDKKEKKIEVYRKLNTNKSIQILSSGVEDTEQSPSSFFKNLCNSLKVNINPYLEISEVYNNIKIFTKPEPVFGELLNKNPEESGSFILFYRGMDFTIYNEKTEVKSIPQVVNNDKIIRIIGIAMCPIGITSFSMGLVLLIGDLVGYSKDLKSKIDYPTTYADYENTYNTFIALFVSGIALTTVGAILTGLSFPLMFYKFEFKKKKIFSLNMSINNGISLYAEYSF